MFSSIVQATGKVSSTTIFFRCYDHQSIIKTVFKFKKISMVQIKTKLLATSQLAIGSYFEEKKRAPIHLKLIR